MEETHHDANDGDTTTCSCTDNTALPQAAAAAIAEPPTASNSAPITLRIRHADETIVNVTVDGTTTVGALKDRISDRYVRLISAGRLLTPDSALLETFSLPPSHVIHAVITKERPQHVSHMVQQATKSELDNDEDEMEGVYYESTQQDDIEAGMRSRSRLPLGFDRLRVTQQLRSTEISILRSHFNAHIDAWLEANETIRLQILRMEPNDALRRRRLQENAWMDAQSETSEFSMNVRSGGTQSQSQQRLPFSNPRAADHAFLGFICGYFFGYYMLLWLYMPSFSKKRKAGIVLGCILRLMVDMTNHPDDATMNDYLDDVV